MDLQTRLRVFLASLIVSLVLRIFFIVIKLLMGFTPTTSVLPTLILTGVFYVVIMEILKGLEK